MYTLYFKPHACSLATHTILNLLDVPFQTVNKDTVSNYNDLNPTGLVPVVKDGERMVREGVAVILYILDRHKNNLLPESGEARETALESMLFANATMHPAYGRLFFISENVSDDNVKLDALNAAAESINQLWQVVESRLGEAPFLGGATMSPADILLTVYSRWGQFFPVDIVMGAKTTRMIEQVMAHDAFKTALAAQ
ncbi:MAG: glutathione S-transferase family protein [Pseudomonadales bacterium]|uniref:Glutathione S-transferase n=1 Tax=Oleiphilus messinensis TaxID=141451 RepID=A0A1Y0IBS2_9GAMM|nr:glutathione S-transferase family protein [Oleiphilus messinensis]ARU57216.1 glutathione S-transferase [Oleiphilus messinensis]MCG8612299.1 glutathione S-transferase family protein [Pseudomonadales bacterium]